MTKIIDFVFSLPPFLNPDGSLDEGSMLAAALGTAADVVREGDFVKENDTMIGVMFSEDEGAIEAVVRFETDRDVEDVQEHLDELDVFVNIRQKGMLSAV